MSIIYCDVDANFAKTQFGTIKNVYNADAVKQSIFTILETRRGERIMRPLFGSNLHYLLFEPVDLETASDIRNEIVSAIRENEDRVIMNFVKIHPFEERNQYVVEMDFNIINNPQSQNIRFGLIQNQYV